MKKALLVAVVGALAGLGFWLGEQEGLRKAKKGLWAEKVAGTEAVYPNPDPPEEAVPGQKYGTYVTADYRVYDGTNRLFRVSHGQFYDPEGRPRASTRDQLFIGECNLGL